MGNANERTRTPEPGEGRRHSSSGSGRFRAGSFRSRGYSKNEIPDSPTYRRARPVLCAVAVVADPSGALPGSATLCATKMGISIREMIEVNIELAEFDFSRVDRWVVPADDSRKEFGFVLGDGGGEYRFQWTERKERTKFLNAVRDFVTERIVDGDEVADGLLFDAVADD